jgi:uncharacterized zinc-type alcohol dehydrogenase-like protein
VLARFGSRHHVVPFRGTGGLGDTEAMPIEAYAAHQPKSQLEPFHYDPGPLGPREVEVRVTHCGICHSDLAMIDNDWQISAYPLVPGHEVVGTVTAAGPEITHLKVGQRVGVGWQCGSCGECEFCESGQPALCAQQRATIVQHHGGWGSAVRTTGDFAIPIPDAIPSEFAGPLMCGGTTVFTPMMHYAVKPTARAAVVGIGGLGHMALQFLKAWGCDVTAISSTHSKEAEARKLGASDFLATKDEGALAGAANRFDFIISTVSADVDWNAYVNMLRPGGMLCIVGVPASDLRIGAMGLILFERQVAGGRTGSPQDIARMLDFAARHNVRPMIEKFPMADVNRAVAHLRSEKARYRVVLEA